MSWMSRRTSSLIRRPADRAWNSWPDDSWCSRSFASSSSVRRHSVRISTGVSRAESAVPIFSETSSVLRESSRRSAIPPIFFGQSRRVASAEAGRFSTAVSSARTARSAAPTDSDNALRLSRCGSFKKAAEAAGGGVQLFSRGGLERGKTDFWARRICIASDSGR